MIDRVAFKFAIPMIIISLLLLAVGSGAAWNVQRQQDSTLNLIVQEMKGLMATNGMHTGFREIYHELQQYLRTHDKSLLKKIPTLHDLTLSHLHEAQQLARTPEETNLIQKITAGYEEFWKQFQLVDREPAGPIQDAFILKLADRILIDRIVVPLQDYAQLSRDLVERTNIASRQTSEMTRRGFLLLGMCGGAGGLIAGLAFARAISRSLVRLDVSVRSVADRLGNVAGPVEISGIVGFKELESGLKQMEGRVVQLVDRLQQSELEVLRSEQLAAVGQLAAGLAHELRNPLMPIKTLVQAALERNDTRGLNGRSLEVVDEEIRRLERSIQSFLDFARPQPLAKTWFDLIPVLEQSLELVSAQADQRGIELKEHYPPSPIHLYADVGQIRQVFVNLLLNAMEAIRSGGEIQVTVRALENDTRRSVELTVSDSGSGVPTEILPRIFDPFVTSKETGTGLGLSICRRIVEAHGGTITARNRSVAGAEFQIRFPAEATVPAGDS